MDKTYLFRSERLGFRNWAEKDLDEFAKINSDPKVMEHFPYLLTKNETAEFIKRLQNHFYQYGFCYFATEILTTKEFIGFIGLNHQEFKTEFTPAVDIGWRIKQSSWGKGYATEGAKKCLEFAFNMLDLEEVISMCPEKNIKSERVMRKIGMQKIGNFDHPKLKDYPAQESCICYRISKIVWQNQ